MAVALTLSSRCLPRRGRGKCSHDFQDSELHSHSACQSEASFGRLRVNLVSDALGALGGRRGGLPVASQVALFSASLAHKSHRWLLSVPYLVRRRRSWSVVRSMVRVIMLFIVVFDIGVDIM